MKEAGITFDIVSEADARRYLDSYSYYFRLKAYAKNYEKYTSTDKHGQYINLDFAYLMDLSDIDASLRDLVLRMSSTLEFYLKVKMISDFNTTDEDGYEIVQELFRMQPELKSKIEEDKSNTSTSNELIAKYKNEWAIWNIVEVLSFGQFSELYALFYNRNDFGEVYLSLIHPVRMIRNAAAHNNCLINRLRPPYSRSNSPSYLLRSELMQNVGLSKKSLDNKLVHPVFHDFAALLFLFSKIVPESARERSYNEMNDLFYNRMLRNKEYYAKNNIIESCYNFVMKIIAHYC